MHLYSISFLIVTTKSLALEAAMDIGYLIPGFEAYSV